MNISNITYHKDRAIIEHRIKVIKFLDCYGAEATKEALAPAVQQFICGNKNSKTTMATWRP